MTGRDHDLASLLGSRVCHDLISPLGAISNGLELLQMESPDDSPELALIADSIANANARIRFFRIAFGLAPDDAMLSRAEIAGIIDDSYRGTRVSVVWEPDGDLPRPEVKIAFLCQLCLLRALPRGGEITVSRGDASSWRLRATGAVLAPDPDSWAALSRPGGLWGGSPADVQFGLLRALMDSDGLALAAQITATEIVMEF